MISAFDMYWYCWLLEGPLGSEKNPAQSCRELLQKGFQKDGAYFVKPDPSKPAFTAFCDQTQDDGLWWSMYAQSYFFVKPFRRLDAVGCLYTFKCSNKFTKIIWLARCLRTTWSFWWKDVQRLISNFYRSKRGNQFRKEYAKECCLSINFAYFWIFR